VIYIKSSVKVQNVLTIQLLVDMPELKVADHHQRTGSHTNVVLTGLIAIYLSLLLALEHIYQDAGDMSSTAGGLLLYLRSRDTIFILTVLNHELNSLGNLSQLIQKASNDLTDAATVTEATICSLEQFDCFSQATARTDKLML
jgi:hypothetical protein